MYNFIEQTILISSIYLTQKGSVPTGLFCWYWSELKIPGHRRQYREKWNLFGGNFQVISGNASFLVKVYEIRIEAAVYIINTEDPVAGYFPFLFWYRRISSRKIEPVIGFHPVLIQPAVFLGEHPIQYIESFRQCDGISCTIHKYSPQFPFFFFFLISDNRDIMTAIITCGILLPVI